MIGRLGALWLALAAMSIAGLSARAQIAVEPVDPSQRQVYLVRQDQSDCSNSDVANVDSPSVAGNVWVTRLYDGNTSIKIATTAKPNTTFFLKCVRKLADVTTDDEGVANLSITVPTSVAGDTFAFVHVFRVFHPAPLLASRLWW